MQAKVLGDTWPAAPSGDMPDMMVSSLTQLAEHYLRNERPVESFALLSFLDAAGARSLRLSKMLLMSAIDIRKVKIARRVLADIYTRIDNGESEHSELDRQLLAYLEQRLDVAEREGEWR